MGIFIKRLTGFILEPQKKRTDKYTPGNKHSRHYDKNEIEKYRKVRSSKHRYVYFCFENKTLRKKAFDSLNYKIEKYPKGNNSNYELGDYLKPNIISKTK
jgi:hypothetical protein